MRRLLVAIITASLAACWGPPGHLSFTGEPPSDGDIWLSDDTGSWDTDDPYSDGVSPVLELADAWCYTTDDSGDWWGFKAQGDDPQGLDTLLAFMADGVRVQDSGGAEVATVALVCEDNGHCWGSAQSDHIDLGCMNPMAYDFVFQVEDQQGHRSTALTVQGRYGTGSTG